MVKGEKMVKLNGAGVVTLPVVHGYYFRSCGLLCVSTEKEERDSEHFQWRTRQNTEKNQKCFWCFGLFKREKDWF